MSCATSWVAIAASAPPAAVARPAPANFADLADQLSATVVNISTTQMLRRPRPPVAENPQDGKGQQQGRQGQNGPSQNGQAQNAPKTAPDQDQETEDLFRDFLDRGQSTPRRVSSLGSGFIIDPSGLIVTNNHVIEDADEVNVTLNDGTTLPAEILGRDTQTDLALLQVKPHAPLMAAKFGDSDKSRVGEWVMAIGNPFGLGGSVTAGIISARNRDINAGPYDDYIQTDAPINRGNSGGPLFNMDGEVIGVNSAIYSPSGGSVGIGFAIPSAIVKSIVGQLRGGGSVKRGLLGVRIQAVTPEIAESVGLESARGAMVAGVTKDGPAAKAGIQVGDLILTFDGKPVPDSRTLPRLVADTPIGKTSNVELLRRGERKTIAVTIGRLQSDDAKDATPEKPKVAAAPHKSATKLGLTLAAITPDLRTRYRIGQEVSGVVVTDVDLDGPAADKNIRAGDVISEVGQQKVTSPQDATAKVDAAAKSGKNVVLLSVVRSGELSFVGVRLAGG
jgi:serine protease Do